MDLKSTVRVIGGVSRVGKSTYARTLAACLGHAYIDMDEQLLMVWGEAGSIRDCFNALGESAFRELEAETYLQWKPQPDSVIALGGGALCDRDILKHTKTWGQCGVLWQPFHIIQQRWSHDAPMGLHPTLWYDTYIQRVRACWAWSVYHWPHDPTELRADHIE